jgi:hypothetical protein
MLRVLERWPPLAWLPVYFASLMILMGGSGKPGQLVAGAILAVLGLGIALYLALRGWPRGRPPTIVWALLGGVVAFYVLSAIAAATLDWEYVVAALAAGVIPLTAASLIVATARVKTVEEGGRLRDKTAADHEDPFPGIGVEDERELGESTQYSDATATPDGRVRPRPASRSTGTR